MRFAATGFIGMQGARSIRILVCMIVAAVSVLVRESSSAAEPLPSPVAKFLESHCVDCHSDGEPEGDLSLELNAIDWRGHDAIETWEHVYQMVSKGIMPPSDADLPTAKFRDEFLQWLDKSLRKNSPIGGTRLRRLSRREYERTINKLFNLSGFQLPPGFPTDNRQNGFTNQAESLVLAATHLEAFGETATLVADQFFPMPSPELKPITFDVPAEEFVVSYSSACLIGGAMRLGATGSITRNATWPMRFEAPATGDYELIIEASTMAPVSQDSAAHETPILTVATMSSDRQGRKEVDTFEVSSSSAQEFRCTARIEKGQTVVFQYANAPMDYENKKTFPTFVENLFREDRRLAAAWRSLGKVARGGSGWQRLKEAMADPALDIESIDPETTQFAKLVKSASGNSVSSGETLVYKYFEQGPNIGIHRVKIRGPVRQYADASFKAAVARRDKFLSPLKGKQDQASVKTFFSDFLTQAFRRPATDAEVAAYAGLVERELQRTQSFDQAMHLALRTTLLSPAFLYRSIGPGELTEFELASRLSYFLTSGPPDGALMSLASSGQLGKSDVLRRVASNQLKKDFAREFTDQWLGLSILESLMPDKRLLSRFDKSYVATMRSEVAETFDHILKNNLPVREFIAPDFLFTNEMVGWDIYQLEQFKPKNRKRIAYNRRLKKISIPRDGNRGGLLCMPAVMMATANGVDTQPVLRGVWLLNNVLGSPPPEPPKAVPALTPDTAGATSPRERLAKHMASESCAACHREIDPLGFVLENYDPIGRWREHYPVFETLDDGKTKQSKGLAIDASGVLPSGQKIEDITDLKRQLADDPTPVARCISEKLLTYATGRSLNYRERQMVADIVEQQKANDLRFRDLFLALIDSKVFRTK